MRTIAASALVIACFTASAQTIDERAAAAGWTATHDPLCATATSNSPMTPFYWEIGDEDATHARSGFAGIGAPGNGDPMAIASASKWVYAAYVAEKFGGSLSAYDIRFLTMSSGYVGMGENQCNPSVSTGPQTVDQCLAKATNGTYFPPWMATGSTTQAISRTMPCTPARAAPATCSTWVRTTKTTSGWNSPRHFTTSSCSRSRCLRVGW